MFRGYPRPNGDQLKFCKIITKPEADEVTIPNDFARRHGHELPRIVALRVPSSCKLWEVEVCKSDDGEILLKNGWKDFKEHFCVKLGGFMVFMFNGGSVFDVFIYDMTCTGIEYPSSDDDSDEETVSNSNGDCEEKTDNIHGSIARGKKLDDGGSCSKKVPKKQSGKAYEKAVAFKAAIPRDIPSFIIIMGRSNTSNQCCLQSIPGLIARDVLSKRFSDIKLHVIGGEIYPARCSLKDAKARITSGWRDLALGNKLKPGDCCVFQISRNNDLEWYVTIFRT